MVDCGSTARHQGAPNLGVVQLLIAADYPFLNIFWTMVIFFCWVAWIFELSDCGSLRLEVRDGGADSR